MSIEQERAAFEVWYQHHHGDRDVYAPDEYADKRVQGAFNVWQARAALQSQDREDAERLDWIEANHGCDISEFADGTWEVDVHDGPYGVGKGMREAIDHARRIEGDL